MKKIFGKIILCFFICINSVAISQEDQAAKAKEFVNKTAQDIIKVMESGSSNQQKKAQLRSMFCKLVDIEWMGKFVIAKEWKKMDDSQKREYMAAYKEYIADGYLDKFSEYNNQNYSINSVKKLSHGHFIVSTEIVDQSSGSKVLVSYRLKSYKSGNPQFKIIDIVAENISLLTTQRSDFNSIISKGGISQLIKILKKKAN